MYTIRFCAWNNKIQNFKHAIFFESILWFAIAIKVVVISVQNPLISNGWNLALKTSTASYHFCSLFDFSKSNVNERKKTHIPFAFGHKSFMGFYQHRRRRLTLSNQALCLGLIWYDNTVLLKTDTFMHGDCIGRPTFDLFLIELHTETKYLPNDKTFFLPFVRRFKALVARK